MWVTCYTDASFSPIDGSAGWAVWLRSDKGRIVKSGPCPEYVHSAEDAELSAIFAGVYLASKNWPETKAVLICSDCRGALRLIGPKAPVCKRPAGRRLQSRLNDLVSQRGLWLRLKWVKGHSREDTTQAFLNGMCDELAGIARKEG